MITGPTPVAVSRALRDAVQRAASGVTTAVLSPQIEHGETKLNLAGRLARPAGHESLSLTIRHTFRVAQDASRPFRSQWWAHTTGYLYTLEGADGREVLAYHWHPAGRSQETEPHLHLGVGAGALRRELVKAHIGTGFVTPDTLFILIIEQFGVRPRRSDWAAVLARSRQTLAMP